MNDWQIWSDYRTGTITLTYEAGERLTCKVAIKAFKKLRKDAKKQIKLEKELLDGV